MGHLCEVRLGQQELRVELSALRREGARHRRQGATSGAVSRRFGGDGVHRTLQVLQVVQPPQSILRRPECVNLLVDTDARDIAAQLQDVAQLLRGNSGLVEPYGCIKGSREADGLDEASRTTPRTASEATG